MKAKTKHPISPQALEREIFPKPSKAQPQKQPQLQPAEPAEVLDRDKNNGQKDHKGAR
jgi:hypothetical protein